MPRKPVLVHRLQLHWVTWSGVRGSVIAHRAAMASADQRPPPRSRGRQPPQHVVQDAARAEIFELVVGIDAAARGEAELARRPSRVTSTSTSWRGWSSATPVIVNFSAPVEAKRSRHSRRRGTAAEARPCRPGWSGGCARSSRRSPRGRRAARCPWPPSRASCRCHIPCRR